MVKQEARFRESSRHLWQSIFGSSTEPRYSRCWSVLSSRALLPWQGIMCAGQEVVSSGGRHTVSFCTMKSLVWIVLLAWSNNRFHSYRFHLLHVDLTERWQELPWGIKSSKPATLGKGAFQGKSQSFPRCLWMSFLPTNFYLAWKVSSYSSLSHLKHCHLKF